MGRAAIEGDVAKLNSETFPPWVVLHIPHDATVIPADVREQFVLDDAELSDEIRRMTDLFTFDLFASRAAEVSVVRAPVSRLAVDVERFAEDDKEPMAARGMGALYEVTSSLSPLRRSLSMAERATLMQDWYRPHHARLENAVTSAVESFGRCLVIDCHSFPSKPLPYEFWDASRPRPDICIGTDGRHTSAAVTTAFTDAFLGTGWSVSVNEPFSGALVPASRYGWDLRVGAVMIEVNRRLYLNEADGTPALGFNDTATRVNACCRQALASLPSFHLK